MASPGLASGKADRSRIVARNFEAETVTACRHAASQFLIVVAADQGQGTVSGRIRTAEAACCAGLVGC